MIGISLSDLWRGGGGGGPSITLSNTIILSNVSTGTTLGTLSAHGVTGTPSFSIVTDADGFWTISGSSVNTTGALTPGPSTFTVGVSGVTPSIPDTTFTATIINASGQYYYYLGF